MTREIWTPVFIGMRDYAGIYRIFPGELERPCKLRCRRAPNEEWFDWTPPKDDLPAEVDMVGWEFRLKEPDELMFGEEAA
jgi:hypothetical protein